MARDNDKSAEAGQCRARLDEEGRVDDDCFTPIFGVGETLFRHFQADGWMDDAVQLC